MYDVNWALNFTGFSKEEPMDLHQFILFYHEHIADFDFQFNTTDTNSPVFIVSSRWSQLPHLMGMKHWTNLPVQQPEKQYEQMHSGKWDLEFLRSADEHAWNEFLPRIEFLPNLYKMLYQGNCTIKLVHKTMDSKFRRRNMDMIFISPQGDIVFVLELRKGRDNIFFPSSVTQYSPNDNTLKGKHNLLKITSITHEKVVSKPIESKPKKRK